MMKNSSFHVAMQSNKGVFAGFNHVKFAVLEMHVFNYFSFQNTAKIFSLKSYRLPRCLINEFFYLKKKCFVLEIFVKSTDLKICDSIISIANPKSYQNETWSNTSVPYEKYFKLAFGSVLETGN